MAKKLYKAFVTSTFYYVAEEGSEHEAAENIIEEALDDDRDKNISIDEVDRFDQLLDWEDHNDLVYGVEGDLTLANAFHQCTGMDHKKSEEEFYGRGYERSPGRWL